jgi:hypothetical protein
MLQLKEVIDSVCRNATQHRPYEFGILSLQDGKEATFPKTARLTRTSPTHVTVDVIDNATRAVTPLDASSVYGVAGAISRIAFAQTQYRGVADEPMFRDLYDVSQRALPYVEGGVLVHKTVESAPCMMCGVVLPLRNLTIDHQRPQAGGELEAVLKTFRAFGLTQEGPKGPKGQAILTHLRGGVPLGKVMPQLGRPAMGGTSLNKRYSLTDEGTMLYSFVAAAGELDSLKSQCMHGLLNLRPVCQACNSSRGNPLRF